MWLSTADGFGRGAARERLHFLEGAGHWEFDHVPVGIWATKLEFFLIVLFGGPGSQGLGGRSERTRK